MSRVMRSTVDGASSALDSRTQFKTSAQRGQWHPRCSHRGGISARGRVRQTARVSHIPPTHRWVAAPDSANQAARAYLRLVLGSRRWWVFVAVVEALFAVLFASTFDARYGVASRLVWGPVFALVPTLVICAVGLGVAHVLNRRRFGQRLGAGVVLESAIDQHHLVLRGPWATSTISVDGIESLLPSGNWVVLQLIGSPIQAMWPAELFPPEELHRLQGLIAARHVE